MTSALHPFRWRRVLMLCAASATLHYAVLDWGGGDGATAPAAAAPRPAPIIAQLRSAPEPAPPASAPEPAAESGAALPLSQVQLSGPQQKVRPGAPEVPRYRASLPPSAQLGFDVVRIDGDGAIAEGQALIDWQLDHGVYRIAMSSDVAGATLLQLASEGAAGAAGMSPRKMTVQRRGKAATATHFDDRERRITFSASEASAALAAGTQDRATLPMQLAGIARAGGQLRPAVTLMVAEEKGVGEVRFSVIGEEEIQTALGPLATWHLAYLPAQGSYRPRLDVWLAPARQWYPVQLRSTEANGAVTTQTINRIVANDVGN